jgi:hypothetical protein
LTDSLTKLVTLFSLCLAAFAAWKALPADERIKRLEVETRELDLALKEADAQLRSLESNRRVTLDLYQEVKRVIEKKEKDPREEEVLRVLVESLADDPFRYKLLRVIAVGAKSEGVKESAAATSRFYEDESTVQARPLAAKSSATAAAVNSDAYNVDFFFCEGKRPTSEPLARAAIYLQSPGATGRWRIRALPEVVNQQPGYAITTSEIRFTAPDETPVAESLAKSLSAKGIKVRFHETVRPTPGYLRVFICQ